MMDKNNSINIEDETSDLNNCINDVIELEGVNIND